jgi:hypothetical protein
MAQAGECLPSMGKALSLNAVLEGGGKKKEERKKEKEKLTWKYICI